MHIYINIYIDAHMVMTRGCTHDESDATKSKDWNDEEDDLCFFELGILIFRFFFFMDDLALEDVALTLGSNIDAGASNETRVADGKPLILTVEWQRDLFKTWIKPKDLILEIENSMTKFKSDENLGAKYDFSFSLFLFQREINYFIIRSCKIKGAFLLFKFDLSSCAATN
jgi:hypothetical protein